MERINLDHEYVGERSNRNPMGDSMTPCYELPNLGISFQQAHAGRAERPGRQIDGIAVRLVGGLESVVRRRVGGIFRRRQRRTAIRELQALRDHHLTEIGQDRSQIVSTSQRIIETGDQPA